METTTSAPTTRCWCAWKSRAAPAATPPAGGAYADRLYGGIKNTVYSETGYDKVYGGNGDDQLFANKTYACQLYGEAGKDTITGSAQNDTIDGGTENDLLNGNAGADLLRGGYGNDVVNGNNDTCYGGYGHDSINGDTGNAVGGGGADQLRGGSDNDFDSFWMDKTDTENHNATQAESDNRCVHRIDAFEYGRSKEPLGQNFGDPSVEDSDTQYYWSGQNLDANPLFPALGPDNDDVDQGGLGDCWFLATLSSIASVNENFIRQSVVELGDGTYAVMFYEDGDKKFYRVDNDLPADRDDNSIAYAGLGAQGAMWAAIMEKAYAMHEGDNDYAGISGGWSEDAFEDMGMGSDEIDVDDDNVMATIKAHLAAGRPVTISSEQGDFEVGDSYVASHAYSVVAVFDDGTILLRNPWGSDAGTQMGAWVQGANDGYVRFTQSSIIDASDDFTVGFW